MKSSDIDRNFSEGKYTEACDLLRKGLEKEGENGRDRLLFLLDLGLALHAAGDYAGSNKVFLEADRFAEIKDYTSLSTEVTTAIVSENLKDYKAEDFEYVLISVYLAMNYSALGQWDDALVEARRVNRKLYLMVSEGKRKYKQNAFAHYLSALLFEMIGEPDNAYVSYKKVMELTPEVPGLGRDLWRIATQLKIREDQERWKKEFSLTEGDLTEAKHFLPKSGNGELVVLFENGISPIKKPNPDFNSLPKFYPRVNPVGHAVVKIDTLASGSTVVFHDIEKAAIENLDEKYGGLVAKKLAGVLAKEGIAIAAESQTDSPLVGFLTRVALYAADQADCRSWNLLPKDLQIFRAALTPGPHEVEIVPVGGESSALKKTVTIEKGKKSFVLLRYTPQF